MCGAAFCIFFKRFWRVGIGDQGVLINALVRYEQLDFCGSRIFYGHHYSTLFFGKSSPIP